MVWGINEWQLPDSLIRPKGSYIKNNILYTPMNVRSDSFFLALQLPENTYLNYIFWQSKDKNGKGLDCWDKNGEKNYNTFVNDNVAPKIHIDKYSQLQFAFSVFMSSFRLFIVGVTLLIFLIILVKRKIFITDFTNKVYWFTGTIISVLIVMSLARYQINYEIQKFPLLLISSFFYDLIFISAFTGVALLIIHKTKKPVYKRILFSLFYVMLISFALMAILNVELIKYLGTPINYQWLYYSDFLQSADAKNALKKNLDASMMMYITYLLLFIVAAGLFLSALLFSVRERKFPRIIIVSVVFILLITGFVQQGVSKLDYKKTANPTYFLIHSYLKVSGEPDIFSMPVSDSIRSEIKNNKQIITASIPHPFPINNIIIYVLESTPAEYLDVYGSKYKATPNLDYWKKYARVYTNIYAHVPATPNSLFSIVSGMYPAISYKLTCNERPDFPVKSIASILSNHWQKGVFQAADINFNQMGTYLMKQGFDTVLDFRNFKCAHSNFMSDWEYLDGVEDMCMTEGALSWIQQSPNKKLALCWTMQTHYPYFVSTNEEKFDTNNADLNRYLNALKNSDAAFGKMMNTLDSLKMLDETMVIVVGDHGEAFGRHNQTTHGSMIYEENVHIPCLLINPKLFHGEKDEQLGGLIDIGPTIADLLNIKPPVEWQGKSLLNSYASNKIFFYCPYADFLFGNRIGNYKLIFNATDSHFELYDLKNDPHETNDLSAKYPAIVKYQYEYLAAWVQNQKQVMHKYLPDHH